MIETMIHARALGQFQMIFNFLTTSYLGIKRKTWGETLSLTKKCLDFGYRISAVFVAGRRIGLL